MQITRRTFLLQLGASGIVTFGAPAPGFLARALRAADEAGRAADGQRVLVLVELAGGNDGLNTVVPFADDEYYKVRPGIAIPKGAVLKLDDALGLHPAMTGFKELFDEGRLAIVQGVGYPEPNRSHFRSMDIWQSARPDTEYTADGWLGRALDAAPPIGGVPGVERTQAPSSSVPSLALGMSKLPLALVGARRAGLTIRDPSGFRLQLGPAARLWQDAHRLTLSALSEETAFPGSDLEFLRQTARDAYASAQRLETVTAGYRPAAEYPQNSLGRNLKMIAQLIAAEFGAAVYFVSLGGFDTHADQSAAHQSLLAELSAAVHAFVKDLEGHRLADRVVLATFSEFGRRVAENGSLGTDHGAASQLFVVTPTGRGGIYGRHPSLTDLTEGDLKFHTDFRSVYATLLEKWLRLPAEPVLGRRFPTLEFV